MAEHAGRARASPPRATAAPVAQQLPPALAVAHAQLGVFRLDPFPSAAALAVLGGDDAALRGLVAAGAVRLVAGKDARYTLRQLVAPGEVPPAAVLRFCTFYARALGAASEAMLRGSRDAPTRFLQDNRAQVRRLLFAAEMPLPPAAVPLLVEHLWELPRVRTAGFGDLLWREGSAAQMQERILAALATPAGKALPDCALLALWANLDKKVAVLKVMKKTGPAQTRVGRLVCASIVLKCSSDVDQVKAAVDIVRAEFGPRHLRTASALLDEALLCCVTEAFERAVTPFREALPILREQLFLRHSCIRLTTRRLADILRKIGNYRGALELYEQRVRELGDETRGEGVELLTEMALTLDSLGEYERALEVLRRQAQLDVLDANTKPEPAAAAAAAAPAVDDTAVPDDEASVAADDKDEGWEDAASADETTEREALLEMMTNKDVVRNYAPVSMLPIDRVPVDPSRWGVADLRDRTRSERVPRAILPPDVRLRLALGHAFGSRPCPEAEQDALEPRSRTWRAADHLRWVLDWCTRNLEPDAFETAMLRHRYMRSSLMLPPPLTEVLRQAWVNAEREQHDHARAFLRSACKYGFETSSEGSEAHHKLACGEYVENAAERNHELRALAISRVVHGERCVHTSRLTRFVSHFARSDLAKVEHCKRALRILRCLPPSEGVDEELVEGLEQLMLLQMEHDKQAVAAAERELRVVESRQRMRERGKRTLFALGGSTDKLNVH